MQLNTNTYIDMHYIYFIVCVLHIHNGSTRICIKKKTNIIVIINLVINTNNICSIETKFDKY